TDLRDVYEAILQSWLGDSEPMYHGRGALPGLFTAPARVGAATTSASTKHTPDRITATTTGAAAPSPDAVKTDATRSKSPAALDKLHVSHGSRGLHPVSAAAAVLFDAFVAALLIRSGKLQELRDAWRARSSD